MASSGCGKVAAAAVCGAPGTHRPRAEIAACLQAHEDPEVLMHVRHAMLAFTPWLLLGCGTERTELEDGNAAPATVDAPAEERAQGPVVFVAQPPAGAQLVFVGERRGEQMALRPGAVFVPLSTFSVERDGIPNEFPPADSMAALLRAAGVQGERFVIAGDPIPAGRAWAAFEYLGLGSRTAVLDGGAAALSSVARGDAPTPAGAQPAPPAQQQSDAELDVDVRDDMIVDAEWVHARLEDPDVVILDARPPAEFSGATPGEGIERPGHIPGARNVFWQTLVRSAEDSRLRDEAELRRIFEEAGATPGRTVIAYCRTGGQGSFLYAVARHLGYDVRLYDGSYVDWSRTQYPVER
jgi:thiosulfate/3-mercaptopyruvate sulfurtransferase